jgi:hypothetical protein
VAKAKQLRPVEKALRLPTLFSVFAPSDPIDGAKIEIETAALEILADNPAPSDRSIFLQYLSTDTSKSSQLHASLSGLAKVGTAEDRSKLLPFLSSKSDFIEWSASQTYLSLSPNIVAAANDLLSAPTKTKVWCVISRALEADDASVWTVLEPFLLNEDEDLRRMACYFAVKTQSKKKLASLLDGYIKGRYFYNVVVIIDRALYAPQSFSKLFLDDEEKWAAKWG